MKKLSILSLCLLSGMAVSAQQAVVKDAEKAMKAGKDYSEVVKIITPAFTNAETANDVETYFVPGKAGFNQYDNLFGQKQLGLLKDGDALKMATALVGGYDNYLKALPLDSIPDEKGKIKAKHSKEIIKVVAGHYTDFKFVAVDFWNEKDYDNAYRAWDIYLTLPENPIFASSVKAEADTIVAEIYFNQALAAWQNDSFDKATIAFKNAIKKGYTKKSVYEYGMSVANSAKDYDGLLDFATQGHALYGADDPQFLNQIINYYLQTERYDDAISYLEKGIAENPNNAQYYSLIGIIYDNKNDRDNAMVNYEKALALDSENALANFYEGRAIAAKAGIMSDEYNGNAYDKYKASTLDPLYQQAAKYLEKAYEVDPNNRSQALQLLEIVYYNLNDAAGMESVKQRRLDD